MKIGVSSCLLGENCKYSGGNNRCQVVLDYLKEKEIVPVCPEVMGGLSIPRDPAEICDSRVITCNGVDVSEAFTEGAERALAHLEAEGAEEVILQPRSPSCGLRQIYDGTFTGHLIDGRGEFASLLLQKGFQAMEPEDLSPAPPIQLIALDMDGTLLNSQKQMPADFIPWVKAHPEIKVVPASGRQYYTLLEMFPGLEGQLVYIADNGALVFYHGEPIHKELMTEKQVLDTLKCGRSIPGVSMILCGVDSAYIEPCPAAVRQEADQYYARLDTVPCLNDMLGKDEFVKIALYFSNEDAEQWLDIIKAQSDGLSCVLSGKCWIDISNSRVGKGEAIRQLQSLWQIPAENCMAFGDYLNDLTMLQAVGESYAMANAHELLKRCAKHMTASNDRDGVMKILRRL